MKEAIVGSDKLRSYLEFKNNEGKIVRFGIEDKRFYFELEGEFYYLTDTDNEMVLPVKSTALGSSANVSVVKTAELILTADDIAGMYATPKTIVAAAAGVAYEFISAVVIYKRATASFTGGGDVTIRNGDAVILSNTVTAANSFTSASDVVRQLKALNAAGGYVATPNKNLTISNATAGFTKGTATGWGSIRVTYIEHTTNL